MAQKKDTSRQTKKKAPSARGKGAPQQTSTRQRRSIRADVCGLVLVALGVFFLVCLFQRDGGLISRKFAEIFRGVFGWGAYPFPLFFLLAGTMVLLYPHVRLRPGAYITLGAVYLILLALVGLIATRERVVLEDYGFGGFVGLFYRQALAGQMGAGAVAGMLIFPLMLYLGKGGTMVLYLLALALLAVVWGFSFRKMSQDITERVDTALQDHQERRAFRSGSHLYVGDVTETEEAPGDLDVIDDTIFAPRRTPVPENREPEIRQEKAPEWITDPIGEPQEAGEPSPAAAEPVPEAPQPVRSTRRARREAAPKEPVPETVEEETPPAPPAPEGEPEERYYKIPPMALLEHAPNSGAGEDTAQRARKLEEALHSFGIRASVVGANCGPVITQFEVQPAPGVKANSIVNLSQDLAMCLAAATIRIEAPIPGKSVIGVEIPNGKAAMVRLRDVIETPEFERAKSPLAFGLGRDIVGRTVIADLAKMPHVLVAGTTGSGKSVCVNTMLISMLYRSSPRDVRLILIDPKVVEMSVYNDIPHLLIPVVTDPQKAAGALKWAVKEMEDRYQRFAAQKVRDIGRYNEVVEDPALHMPYIVIIIDEMADLMMVAARDVEDSVCRLAQKARAAGMHLVLATQTPRADVITGMIKANVPSRIGLAVSSQIDSRVILDMTGAEKLLGRGDMLYMPMGANKPTRVQGAYVDDEEVERVVDFIREEMQDDAVGYDEAILDKVESYVIEEDDRAEDAEDGRPLDPLLRQAVDVVLEQGQASISMVQRRLRVGYARAARLVDEMELLGIVGPNIGSKAREIVKTRAEIDSILSDDDLPDDEE